jgi:pSer/pThr/pTyr-binding forkhead associated (FHA) protein
MPAFLRALNGGPDILVDETTPIVVGRDPLCDARITCNRVSRQHCAIGVVDGEVAVRDLGSTNGTLINGHLVISGRLHPGDILSLAGFRYRLEKGSLSMRSGPARPSQAGQSGEFATRLGETH